MTAPFATVTTPVLEIGYLEWNAGARDTVVLLHGWPDCAASWTPVAERLAAAGYRVLCPALRGYNPTRFLSPDTPRSGQFAALARDLIDFIKAMALDHPSVIGHDWGGRAAAAACALEPQAIRHLGVLSVGYSGSGPDQPLGLSQARQYWYHWYLATPRGKTTVETDPETFARILWDTWSPAGWYAESDFRRAVAAFANPDWAEVVVHYYRHRWGFADGDPDYAADQARVDTLPRLEPPTLVIHGADDGCVEPAATARFGDHVSGRFQRVLLDGVGHFPHLEAPDQVSAALLDFINRP